MAKFSKEAWKSDQKTIIYQIYSRTYDHSLKHARELVKEATNDFPGLMDDEIRIEIFAGDNRNGMMVVEFHLPGEQIHQKYEEIKNPISIR